MFDRYLALDPTSHLIVTVSFAFGYVLLIASLVFYGQKWSAYKMSKSEKLDYVETQSMVRELLQPTAMHPVNLRISAEPGIKLQIRGPHFIVSDAAFTDLMPEETHFMLLSQYEMLKILGKKCWWTALLPAILCFGPFFILMAFAPKHTSLTYFWLPIALIIMFWLSQHLGTFGLRYYPEADKAVLSRTQNPEAAISALQKTLDSSLDRNDPFYRSAQERLKILSSLPNKAQTSPQIN